MRPYKTNITLSSPADIYVYTQGTVWAMGENLYYALPHYSYGRTLIKLPHPPKILTIFSTGKITKIEALEFNPDRR